MAGFSPKRRIPDAHEPVYGRADRALKIWLLNNSSDTATIEPGKPWQNGSVESFNGTFRAECLDREWFANLHEARW